MCILSGKQLHKRWGILCLRSSSLYVLEAQNGYLFFDAITRMLNKHGSWMCYKERDSFLLVIFFCTFFMNRKAPRQLFLRFLIKKQAMEILKTTVIIFEFCSFVIKFWIFYRFSNILRYIRYDWIIRLNGSNERLTLLGWFNRNKHTFSQIQTNYFSLQHF